MISNLKTLFSNKYRISVIFYDRLYEKLNSYHFLDTQLVIRNMDCNISMTDMPLTLVRLH